MRGLDFFREAVALSERYRRPSQRVQHTIQTNGTLLNDEWGQFLAANGFLVGISFDGPPDLHDAYRTNKAGRRTYAQVKRGWDVLARHGVEVNILCTVNAVNAAHPERVYRHFRDELGARFLQFIPIVERVPDGMAQEAERGWRDEDGTFVLYRQAGSGVTSRTVEPQAWGDFLVAVFDLWRASDIGTVFVQSFDTALAAAFGIYNLCVHAPECGTALAVEHNGEVYSCDHYVEPEYRLGSLVDAPFGAIATQPRQRDFGMAKRAGLPRQCLQCPVRWACHGGCPKDRFSQTSDGEGGLNYLCPGYRRFFTHIQPDIAAMARLVRAGREAAELMQRE